MTEGPERKVPEAGNVTSEKQALQGGAVTGPSKGGERTRPGGVGQEAHSRCQAEKMEECQHRKYLQHLCKRK